MAWSKIEPGVFTFTYNALDQYTEILFRKYENAMATVSTTENCLWVKYFSSTKYLIRKWSFVTTCKCPDSEETYDGEDKAILSQYVNKKARSTITQGTIGIGYDKAL
jgi:hypothetical protein